MLLFYETYMLILNLMPATQNNLQKSLKRQTKDWKSWWNLVEHLTTN